MEEEVPVTLAYVWENVCSEFGGYTLLAISSGLLLKALLNTMYPVNGDEAQLKSKAPYAYMALFSVGVYLQAMCWIFQSTDFKPGMMTSVIKLGPR